MTESEIVEALETYVRDRFQVPEQDPDFGPNIDLFNYGYIDSFGAVDLSSFIEKTFAIRVTDSDWITNPMNTISEISTFIFKRLTN